MPQTELAPSAHGIATIEDTLTFKIARFAALDARGGTIVFRDAFELTLNEWRVLGLVAAHGPLGLQQLADRVLMDKGQLSRTVAALVARGKLVSRPSADDARKVALSLTAKGIDRHDQGLEFARARHAAILSVLSADEAHCFVAMLDRLLDHTDRLGRITDTETGTGTGTD